MTAPMFVDPAGMSWHRRPDGSWTDGLVVYPNLKMVEQAHGPLRRVDTHPAPENPVRRPSWEQDAWQTPAWLPRTLIAAAVVVGGSVLLALIAQAATNG